MSSIKFDDLVLKYEVPFWDHIKDNIAFDIEKYPRFGVTTIDQEIYSTDFFAPMNSKVPWCDAFKKLVVDHQEWLAGELTESKQGIEISPVHVSPINVWFQQYRKMDTHGWHIHPDSWYASVLYVDLPEGQNATTEIFIAGNTYKVDSKVGEVVSFPAFFHHRSAPFEESEEMKTVIAWNSGPPPGMSV